MERCDFGLDDLIRPVRDTRFLYERRSQQTRDTVSNPCAHRFSEKEICKLMQEMVSALVFLNSCGIIHQDVKTDNILWKHGTTEGVYKLCDFGVMVVAPSLENPRLPVPPKGKPAGTLWTMAPEILRGLHRDAAADVWSLGCVLYEFALLDKPFNSIELMAFQNDITAKLPDIFPKKEVKIRNAENIISSRQSKQAIRPTQRSRSMTTFSEIKPLPRLRRKWIYSLELKSLLQLCFVITGKDRMTPGEMLGSKEFESAIKEAIEGGCKATVTSEDFYRASLKQHRLRYKLEQEPLVVEGH